MGWTVVHSGDGREFRAVRQVLNDFHRRRHVVVAGDLSAFAPRALSRIVLSAQPRLGILSRTSKGKRHILVSNIQQVLIGPPPPSPI